MEKIQSRMTTAEKALLRMVKDGEAVEHTVRVKLIDDSERDFTFYKVKESVSIRRRKTIPQQEIHTNFY